MTKYPDGDGPELPTAGADPVVWARTPDRRVWAARSGDRVLTVTRTADGAWRAAVDTGRSPGMCTRLAAQRWAESHAELSS